MSDTHQSVPSDNNPESWGRDPWLDVPAAARRLSCKPRRIYELVADGHLRYARDGRRLLFRVEWLDATLTVSPDA